MLGHALAVISIYLYCFSASQFPLALFHAIHLHQRSRIGIAAALVAYRERMRAFTSVLLRLPIVNKPTLAAHLKHE
jgi:hypothetical protein